MVTPVSSFFLKQILPRPGKPDEVYLPGSASPGPGTYSTFSQHPGQLCYPLSPVSDHCLCHSWHRGCAIGSQEYEQYDDSHFCGYVGSDLVFPHQLPAVIHSPCHCLFGCCDRILQFPCFWNVWTISSNNGGGEALAVFQAWILLVLYFHLLMPCNGKSTYPEVYTDSGVGEEAPQTPSFEDNFISAVSTAAEFGCFVKTGDRSG